jgi:hypothetical protein
LAALSDPRHLSPVEPALAAPPSACRHPPPQAGEVGCGQGRATRRLLPFTGEGAGRRKRGATNPTCSAQDAGRLRRNTPDVSSLRKQGPNSKPALVISWVPAFAGMTASGKAQSPERFRNLSPRFLNVIDSRLSPVSKRDHDEWLGWGMVGWFGGRSGPGQKYLGMGQFAGQAAVNARVIQSGMAQGARPPRLRRSGKVGNAGSPGLSGRPCFTRCGTGCSRARVP